MENNEKKVTEVEKLARFVRRFLVLGIIFAILVVASKFIKVPTKYGFKTSLYNYVRYAGKPPISACIDDIREDFNEKYDEFWDNLHKEKDDEFWKNFE